MIVNEIIKKYNETCSIKATAESAGCSWMRVVKILSSNGIVINDIHATFLKLYASGKTAKEISDQTGYSYKVIQAYLPAVRPYYNVNPSENAKAIKRHRAKMNKGKG